MQNSNAEHPEDNLSTGSSHASTPEMERKNSVIRRDPESQSSSKVQVEFLQQHRQNQQAQQRKEPPAVRNSEQFLGSQRSPENMSQTQTEFLQAHRQQQLLAQQLIKNEQQHSAKEQSHVNDKPPIPPRGAPPPVPARSPSSESVPPIRRYGMFSTNI